MFFEDCHCHLKRKIYFATSIFENFILWVLSMYRCIKNAPFVTCPMVNIRDFQGKNSPKLVINYVKGILSKISGLKMVPNWL
jgi:hypothetical protein